MILDNNIDDEIPIIFERQFLEFRRALLDVGRGKLNFRVNDDEVNLTFGCS